MFGAVTAVAVLGATATASYGSSSRHTYVVRSGDSLTSIAAHYGVRLSTLAAANHLAQPDRIVIGETLVIPGSGSGSGSGGSGSGGSGSGGSGGSGSGPLAHVYAPAGGSPRWPAQLLAHSSRLSLRPLFQHWAADYGVPAGLLESLAWMESGWQQSRISSTGAIGVGQLEPSTATFVSTQILGLDTTLDPHSTTANIRMSAAYLAWLLRSTDWSVANALGAYYQGLGSLRSSGPLSSTRQYVLVIGELWGAFRSG